MSKHVPRTLATPGALVVSLVLAAQASAASWGPSVALSSSGHAEAGGLVALRNSVVVATYEDGGSVFVRRSTDSGVTWQPPQQIGPTASAPAIAGRGELVDLAWSTGSAIRYVGSKDAGGSFGSIKTLASRSAGGLGSAVVARGPDNVVAVAWTRDGIARARVSRDGGRTFGPTATVNHLVAQGVTAIAVGNRVVYVAAAGLAVGCDGGCAAHAFGIWRSVDRGGSWAEAMYKVESGAVHSIDAIGDRAFAGANYSPAWSLFIEAMYFKTTNRGGSWSGPWTISEGDGDISGPVIVSVRNDRLRASWTFNYLDPNAQLAYRERPLKGPWSPVAILAEGGNPTAAGVDHHGSPVVLFTTTEDDGSGTGCCDAVRAITRSP